MKECRIIERIHPSGRIDYVIQQKNFWGWVDAWENYCGFYRQDIWPTLKDAKDNRWRFDGSKCQEKVMESED